jgi:hypothetical protein
VFIPVEGNGLVSSTPTFRSQGTARRYLPSVPCLLPTRPRLKLRDLFPPMGAGAICAGSFVEMGAALPRPMLAAYCGLLRPSADKTE